MFTIVANKLKKMDLQKIIQDSGFKIEFVAAKLFPDNAHPYNALSRVLREGRELKADQVKTLAEVLGVTADSLLGLSWSGKVSDGALAIKCDRHFVAVLPRQGVWELRKVGALIATFPLKGGLTVKDFIAEVETEINKLT